MSRIRVETTITNHKTKETIKKELDAIMAIMTNNRIVYKEDGIISLDILEDRIILKRTTHDREMTLEFIENKKTKCIYNVLNHRIDLNVYTKKIIKNDKLIEIDYSIEEESIKYKLVIK